MEWSVGANEKYEWSPGGVLVQIKNQGGVEWVGANEKLLLRRRPIG